MISDKEKALWQQMADMTAPLCAGNAPGACRAPHSCCDSIYCEMAMERAKELGEALASTGHPTLPCMGPDGCIAAPYLRPICTVHVCCINGFGFNPSDPMWTKQYFRLRHKLERYSIEVADLSGGI